MSEAQTPAGPPVVSLKKINIRYGNHHAVRDVSLDIARGEVVAMVGPSGAGKSTLLRAINMLETPSSGTLHVGDFTFSLDHRLSQKELLALRRSTGMVFQQFNLFPHMTVEKNISLPQMRVLGRSRAEADKVTARLLERVHLGDKAKAYPARLSGGQQQRIAIARALALDPEVMLFDEPTSALDPELGLEVLAVMRELAASGMTMIVVTHEMSFARNVSENVMIMADGKILEHGPSREVMDDPQHERTRRFLRAVTDR